VSDVADDRHVDAGQPAEALADGEGVEESLGRMFVRSVAGVDDRNVRRRSPASSARPGCLARMTIMSGCMATRFSAVSMSVSPFSTDDPDAVKLSVSADRRFSAISNDTRVRVDASIEEG